MTASSLLRPVVVGTIALTVACSAQTPDAPVAAEATTAAPSTPRPPTPRPTAMPSPEFWVEAPIVGDPSPIRAKVPVTGVVLDGATARLLPPASLPPVRRVGVQVGHWQLVNVPPELPGLRYQPGAVYAGVVEVELNLDVAQRIVRILREHGIVADLLPAVLPPGYLADAFVAIHADADDLGERKGFKLAHGFYRTPWDDLLVALITSEYAEATGLPWDYRITDDMTDYYAFAWFRYQHSLAPHTPAAIVEMGVLTEDRDRALLVSQPMLIASAIARGIMHFLEAAPQSELFRDEIRVRTVPPP